MHSVAGRQIREHLTEKMGLRKDLQEAVAET